LSVPRNTWKKVFCRQRRTLCPWWGKRNSCVSLPP
jgi:hypothetical protein